MDDEYDEEKDMDADNNTEKDEGSNDSVWHNFDEVWEKFYSLPQRRNRPTDSEKEIAREICEDCNASQFRVRDDGEIVFAMHHVVHINPGFMSTKMAARHVFESDKYAGFTHRYEFTNFVSPPPPSQPEVGKVLCPEFGVRVRPGLECGYCGETHWLD